MLIACLAGCTIAPQHAIDSGYFTQEWTFNGGTEFWIRPDGTYVWRQSLFYCSPNEHGDIGWFNQEQGTWTAVGSTIALHRASSVISNSYVAGLYFDKHRSFAVGGSKGHRVLLSGAADDTITLKEAEDTNHVDPWISKKPPNQAPEPTTLRVTPAADAPVAPRSVAARL